MRPLLGGGTTSSGGKGNAAKDADRAPTFRVPGASLAAGAPAAAASGNAGVGNRGTGSRGTTTPPAAAENSGGTARGIGQRAGEVDEEGFQRVVRRGSRRGDGGGTEGGDGTQGAGERPLGNEEHRTSAGGPSGTDEDGGDGGEGAAPTPAELHQAWLDEVGLVRKLRMQGVQGGHPALRAACEARDAAERAWRGSKDPAPASVRLGRAQSKLDRAVTLQAEARQAIMDAERAHKEKMATLQSAMDECTERVRMRREQLREVQKEVGAGGASGGGGPQAKAQQEAIRQVHQTICGEVGPTIAALVEQIDTDAPAWAALNGLLGKLSASKAALEGACTHHDTDHYDIGGDDHADGLDDWDARSEWSESHDLRGQAWGGGRSGRRDDEKVGDGDDWACQQRDTRGGAADKGDDADDYDHSMGTGDWWDAPAPTRRWSDGTRWQSGGHGKWHRASWADQSEGMLPGAELEEEEGGPPPAARRRLGDAGAEQGDGAAQGKGTAAAAGTQEEDPEARKRQHAQRLEQIITMAINAGVNPLTAGGEDLRLLDPHQLDEWVAANLPSALLC